MSEHFTQAEASALIGKTFESVVEFSGVPKGTRGQVIAADAGGLGHWDVVIEWDLPKRPSNHYEVLHEGERVLVIQTGKPLRDWFDKMELAQFMRVVENA